MLDVSDWKDYVEDSVQTLESDVRKVHGTPSLPHSQQPTSTTTSQWFHLSMPSKKKAWQPSELAWCRKWDREENKKMSRKDQQHQLCSVSTKLEKGEAEDVWTTRWRTRNCWSPLLHESHQMCEGMKSLTQQWKENMVLKIAQDIKRGFISLNCKEKVSHQVWLAPL